MKVRYINPKPAKGPSKRASNSGSSNQKREDTMANKKASGSGKSKTRSPKKKNPTVPTKRAVVPANVKKQNRRKRRNGSDSVMDVVTQIAVGTLSYIGTNVIGKAVANMAPVSYANHARVGTKAAITGGLIWKGKDFLGKHSTPAAIGAGVATVEDAFKTYVPTIAPAFVGDIIDLGGFNDVTVEEAELPDGQQFALGQEQEQIPLADVVEDEAY